MSTSGDDINRHINPGGTKGHTDVTSETDNKTGRLASLMGRRRFLAFGATGAALAVGGAGAVSALIRVGGDHPASPRSKPPVGLTGERDPDAESRSTAARGGVRYLALAGTDGWATMPSASLAGATKGIADTMYFPDPLAEWPNRTTYVFSFRNVTGLDREIVAGQKGRTQVCAPLFYSTVGEELWVTLTNLGLKLRPDLVDGHTLHWHGFRNAIPFYDGVPESSISVPIGRDFTYVYRPEDAGTYMYHCHFEDVEHVTMGMQGIVFVKPEPKPGNLVHPKQAYGKSDGDVDGVTNYVREFAILLGEIDNRAHFNDAHIQATDWTDFHPEFSTMNGRAYPDTLEPNGWRDAEGDLNAQINPHLVAGVWQFDQVKDDSNAARLQSNPHSSVVEAKPGERVLIRMVNLGFYNRTIVFPGIDVDVLGRDARFVPTHAQRLRTDSVQLGPGESRDVFFTAPAEGDYPFYDRDLSRYPGSKASGGDFDGWVGGARSVIRVRAGLADQLKPNGWAGEDYWPGEHSLEAVPPAVPVAPTIVIHGQVRADGRYVYGTVAVDPSTQLYRLQWARANSTSSNANPPNANSAAWTDMPFIDGTPNTFDSRVSTSTTGSARNYWVRAVDLNNKSAISAAARM